MVTEFVLLLAVSVPVAHAPRQVRPHQQKQKQNQKQNQNQDQASVQPVSLDGVITSTAAGAIQMTTDPTQNPKQKPKAKQGGDAGQPTTWSITTLPNAKILVSGTAKLDFLRPGLAIQFEADVDAHGAVDTPVKALTIVTVSRENPVGIVPAGVANPPEVEHAAGAKTPAKKPALEPGPAKIVAQINACHGKKLTLHAGSHALQIELTDEPAISVAMTSVSFATAGDKIVAHGKAVKPGVCAADDVKITLSEPLTGSKKRPASAQSEAKGSQTSAPSGQAAVAAN